VRREGRARLRVALSPHRQVSRIASIRPPSDGFINDTLEHLRQNVRIGVTRGDERQI
jgi:hypothetical protein